MSSISRSIAQAVAPAVRRAASTAAPAAAQSAKEGFKLVEVRLLIQSSKEFRRCRLPYNIDYLQVLYAVPPLLAIVGYGGTVCFHETGALRRIRRSFAEVPH